MNDIVMVYTTFPSAAEAERVAESLLEAKLAACVNILPSITSLYEWQGKLTRETEASAFVKTTQDRVPGLIDELKRLHPYDTPAVLVLPVTGGNADYMAWLRGQLG